MVLSVNLYTKAWTPYKYIVYIFYYDTKYLSEMYKAKQSPFARLENDLNLNPFTLLTHIHLSLSLSFSHLRIYIHPLYSLCKNHPLEITWKLHNHLCINNALIFNHPC